MYDGREVGREGRMVARPLAERHGQADRQADRLVSSLNCFQTYMGFEATG